MRPATRTPLRDLGRTSLRTFFIGVMVMSGLLMTTEFVIFQVDRLQGTSVQGPREDYVAFYAAGRMVLDGQGDALYDRDLIAAKEHELMGRPVGGRGELAFFNPPFVALGLALPALVPISQFSLVLTIILLGVIAAAGLSLSGYLKLTGYGLILFWAGFLSLRSVQWLLLEGQLSFFIFFAWFGFLFFHTQGKSKLAGLSLVLGLVKPQTLVVLLALLVWKRQWETLRTFSIAAAVLVAVSVAVSGPSVLVAYPTFVFQSTGFDGHGVATEGMFGLNGLVARLTGDSTPSSLWFLAVAPPVVIAIVDAWRRTELRGQETSTLIALTLAGALLLNPHLYFQDMVLVPLVLAFAAHGTYQRSGNYAWWPAAAGVVWIIQFFNFTLADHNLNLLTPALIVLFFAAYGQLRSSTQAAREVASHGAAEVYLPREAAA